MRNIQTFKLALICFILSAMLYVPGVVYAQQKNVDKIQLYHLPIANHTNSNGNIGEGIRDWGVTQQIQISAMAPIHVSKKVIIPFVPSNIRNHGYLNLYLDNGNGVPAFFDTIFVTEAHNNNIISTEISYTALQNSNARLIIQGCQDQMGNCTSVIIIVTVDGSPPIHLSNPTGN